MRFLDVYGALVGSDSRIERSECRHLESCRNPKENATSIILTSADDRDGTVARHRVNATWSIPACFRVAVPLPLELTSCSSEVLFSSCSCWRSSRGTHQRSCRPLGRRSSSTWTSPKTDEVVERAVQAGKKIRVIIRYQPQYRSLVNSYLQTKGAKWHAEIRGLNVVAVELTASAVKFVATLPIVINISSDSAVGVPNPGIVAENPYYLSPEYDGQELRKTLGLLPADTGRNVGVAIIDSGIAPTADLAGRITRVLRLHQHGHGGGHRCLGRIRARHAHRRPHCRLGCQFERQIRRHGHGRPTDWPEGARRAGQRLHERRHCRDRLRDDQPRGARHRRPQPVARPSHLRAGGHGPDGAGRRARRRRRHRRRRLGRQHGHESDDRAGRLRGHHLARQRAVRADGRFRAPQGDGEPSRTTKFRCSARAVPRGTTA